ncbi:helix-turn-helix transcriptional regulator [Actinomadura madurae]|uniref:helix-turn-helix transcriptional regulator n=1 Tax=Actinomadura madurae TaxID=1993 RepID=UPI0020D20354|nr:helix-turn-helix transcriptional regulator [Actinomadura madurae]MCP9964238.1 helix-turn-helix transcriptional regulator [Actinomadura madurae]
MNTTTLDSTTTARRPRGGAGPRRRTELAAFLRSRRERITPEDVGMPPGPRRRTPGLRREEVAQLAGVGVTWYTWLEQGRPINASTQVLDAVARTLRLDGAEREHLYRLADVPDAAVEEGAPTLPMDMQAILDGLLPMPATVANGRCDVLAWNSAYAAMVPHVTTAGPCERNSMWMAFTLPPCCNPVVNFEETAPGLVAVFRHRYSRHLDEPGWKELVRRAAGGEPRVRAAVGVPGRRAARRGRQGLPAPGGGGRSARAPRAWTSPRPRGRGSSSTPRPTTRAATGSAGCSPTPRPPHLSTATEQRH